MRNQITTLQNALETRFFAPLRRRAGTLTSPAREHLARLERGESIESIALDYGSAEEDRHA
jgi:hypothetical protein